ncbi:MAG TPA: hypothetical protein DIT07_10955, partial [Sphingobacteriaceae bacterium]|nr:hypothetical protein [Sphingobacteriaceae bacterium]
KYNNQLDGYLIEPVLELYTTKYDKYLNEESLGRYDSKTFIYKWTLDSNEIKIEKWYSYYHDRTFLDKQDLQWPYDNLSSFSIEYSDNRYIQSIKKEQDSLKKNYKTKANKTLEDL